MSATPAERFLHDAAVKSADVVHHQILSVSMENHAIAHLKARARFHNWEAARSKAQKIKREAIDHLDRYLVQFEEKVKARGGYVFWAENADEARAYVKDLAARHHVRTVVKSKSMVTEEVHLTQALEQAGMKVWETDLGEYIMQLRNEAPYHIVTPAIHLNRHQISQTFRERLGADVPGDDPGGLVAVARRTLRQAFFAADMGVTGANFIVADSGMVALSTNEGNGRLCTSLPRIQVAVTGIEKVVPRLEDLGLMWQVLAASGTGQPLTTYNTLVGGPRGPGEPDGPEEFHVVLLDNGRSSLLADPEQREVLHCIRCGACLNACPVFSRVGGHAYGTTYSGPIGSVLTPHMRGPQFQHLSYASSLCGACTSVCPVRIDLHHHLLHNRRNAAVLKQTKLVERMTFRVWRHVMLHPRLYALNGWLTRRTLRALYALGLAGSILDPLRAWNRGRTPVPLPSQSFRARWKEYEKSSDFRRNQPAAY